MAELDTLGVEYDARARKADLSDLLWSAVMGEDPSDGDRG
jgi:hypothetical protein